MSDVKFAAGVFVKEGKFGTKVSICLEDFKAFANTNAKKSEKNGKHYLNLDILTSKEKGTLYCKLDEFEPQKQEAGNSMPDDSLPF